MIGKNGYSLSMTTTILLIDDDSKLTTLLSDYLTNNGYAVHSLPDGLNALERLRTISPDLVILDYMMPGKDGLEVLRDIRGMYDTPVIMLTAKGEETDRIVGLELGADDYLPKPFNPRELLARIKAVLRRHIPERLEKTKVPHSIESGGLTLNTANFTVTTGKNTVELSTTEFKILEVLMRHPDQVLNRDQLMQMARGRDFLAFDRSIDIHISKLRAKIEADPTSPKRIRTIWGSGYMFVGAQ